VHQHQQEGEGFHCAGPGGLAGAFAGFDSPDTSTSGEEEEEIDVGECA
jgi:hypothetical protein